ncbi:hypothetical protein [Yersinia kristensenii]|uniref:phage tail fiber protein n=1 Tax=Yersinia kristensenii TaxID=28152 RepID=UPI0015625905|nr:hypothetical protein [Yersinia kristensenii]QKJ15577.1 hypothetical protein HRD70_10520 [Yersinia kristensenii]
MGDIFTGSNTCLMYCDDLTNTSPQNKNLKKIKNLSTFPTFSQSSEVSKLETFDSEYSHVQMGSMNIEPITITVNYVLDDQVLEQYYDQGTEFQLMLCMEDSEDVLNYIILNGQISSTQIDGDKDTQVTKKYSFETTDIQARGSITNTELYRGDFGLGSDGANFPHNNNSTGNGFFLLDKNASNNSLGVDLIGTQTVNNGKTSQMLISDVGTNPILRIRSNNGSLVKIYSSVEKPTLGELGGVSLTDLNTAKSELKLYTDTTFSTKTSVSTDIATLKTYSDTTFSTKTDLTNGLDIKLSLAGGIMTGGITSTVASAITLRPLDATSYNWIHWTQIDGTQGWRMGRLENNGAFYIRDYSAGGTTALNLKQGEYILTTGNTTVDSNGFLKKASPIVKLYGDGKSESNYESQGATSERISEGVYKISGVLGFNSDDSWGGVSGGIEIPLDINKNPLIWVDYDIEENGDLIIKTYHRTHTLSPSFAQNTVKNYMDGQPIDIPHGRFIDLRVQMPEAPTNK